MSAETLLDRTLAELTASPYAQRIGLDPDRIDDGSATVLLPHRDSNTNSGGALHGGTIASLMLTSAGLAATSTQRPGDHGCGRTLNLAISFLSAARRDDLIGRSTLARRGRDTAHVENEVTTSDGRRVATGFVTYRFAQADEDVAQRLLSPAAQAGPPPGPAPSKVPQTRSAYNAGTGITFVDVRPAWACARVPLAHNEGAAGRIHEGAMTGLIDTCAAMSAWPEPRRSRAASFATVAMWVSFCAPVGGDLRAASRLVGRAGEATQNEVEVWAEADSMLAAVATVSYRALLEDGAG